jgi:hypothetical protein
VETAQGGAPAPEDLPPLQKVTAIQELPPPPPSS